MGGKQVVLERVCVRRRCSFFRLLGQVEGGQILECWSLDQKPGWLFRIADASIYVFSVPPKRNFRFVCFFSEIRECTQTKFRTFFVATFETSQTCKSCTKILRIMRVKFALSCFWILDPIIVPLLEPVLA